MVHGLSRCLFDAESDTCEESIGRPLKICENEGLLDMLMVLSEGNRSDMAASMGRVNGWNAGA